MSHLLLAEARAVRMRALRDCHALHAIRRVLFADRDAEVRAAAARRLGELVEPAIEAWLVEALGDRSPLVRDSVLRALAKRGTVDAVAPVRALTHADRMWWVRRSAVYALAAIVSAHGAPTIGSMTRGSGADELPAFTAAMADPFWRVRHAAVRVLAVLGARDPEIRDAITSAPPTSAIAYLRAAWGPVALETPQRAASTTSQLPAELLDEDPAVVTARLAALPVSPVALVELLCDPHAPLRDLAVERIGASGDTTAYIAALDWLEEHRIPHVADTVEAMLDGLGDLAVDVALHALARPERRGALRWAIGWIAATRYTELYDRARACAVADPSLRAVALRLAPADELVGWAADPALRDAIALELYARHAFAALDQLVGQLAGGPRVRALQLDAHARRGTWELVIAGLADPHHGPRAVATRWLVKLGHIDGAAQRRDPDPAVREAALTAASTVAFDDDPFIARAQAALGTLAGHDHADPWIRATTMARAPLARVLELWADRDDMVRAAAQDALGHATDHDVRALLATDLSPLARTMAQAWLHRALDPAAARAAIAAEPGHRARALLGAIAGDAPAVREQPPFVREDAAPAQVAQRSLAGIPVAPLVISGAFELPAASLAHAYERGANAFFWEPAYEELTRFARGKRRARVIAGSYHADAASIELDIDRALKRLRRDALDLFLLFWSRSTARVDAEAFAMMATLRASGKVRAIGFSTHHRTLAREAIEASPWDAVMIRHSAAHPGIETELLPTARAKGTAILTFSALCYGRMVSGPGAPSAVDCYRYALAQPGVTACISAPRRHDELVENLAALTAPPLPAAQLAAMRAHGAGVRAESHRFNTLMRQPTRDAAAAARELLAAELPPDELVVQRPLPHAGVSRGARTSLGSSRRGRR